MTGMYASHALKLVAIAKSRQRLDEQRYYCLLTNQSHLRHTKIFRHSLKRGQIEWLFKALNPTSGCWAFNITGIIGANTASGLAQNLLTQLKC